MIPNFAVGLLTILLLTVVRSNTDIKQRCSGTVRYLGEDDWQDILEGKWVVKFFASWCPACKSFKSDWEELAGKFYEAGFCTAAADVSLNAGLSGRFFVTSLPTFYMMQDGEVRMYSGVRSKDGLSNFVLSEGWKDTPTVPWYISPTSYHMATLGAFFRFSMALRNLHTSITEEYGIPSWISYIAFALLTILVGLLIGLVIVFFCDMSLGPASPAERKKRADPFGMEESIEDDEDVIDDVKGQTEDDDDEEEDENPEVAGEADDEEEGDVGVGTPGKEGGEVRKRNLEGDAERIGDVLEAEK